MEFAIIETYYSSRFVFFDHGSFHLYKLFLLPGAAVSKPRHPLFRIIVLCNNFHATDSIGSGKLGYYCRFAFC
jgi:hypothetical protein